MVYVESLGIAGNVALKVAARVLVGELYPGISGMPRAIAVVTTERAFADLIENSENPGFGGSVALKSAARLVIGKIAPELSGPARIAAIVAAQKAIQEALSHH